MADPMGLIEETGNSSKTNYNRYLKVSKARNIVNKTGTDFSLENSPLTLPDSLLALDCSSLVLTMTDVSQIATTLSFNQSSSKLKRTIRLSGY